MRKIIHIDMDAFFAAVEMRDNPSLKNIPMAIGDSQDRRGVISTSNYEARNFGVRSAMSVSKALMLCPHLTLIKGQMHKYKKASETIFSIFNEYTDVVEGLSLDEAYLDVTNSDLFSNSATLIAQDIRKKIFIKTNGLTASAGIAPNKLIAKIASDFKKPNGQFTVSPHEVAEFIKPIPVEKIWGVGKVTASELHQMGIKTCLDVQSLSRSALTNKFGKYGETLYNFSRGDDQREVETEHERKSLGTEETFSKDLNQFSEMKDHICRMYQDVELLLNNYSDRKIKSLQLKIKYFDFKQTTIERQIPFNVENFLFLFEQRWQQDPRPIRLLGVGVKFEETKPLFQLAFFDESASLS